MNPSFLRLQDSPIGAYLKCGADQLPPRRPSEGKERPDQRKHGEQQAREAKLRTALSALRLPQDAARLPTWPGVAGQADRGRVLLGAHPVASTATARALTSMRSIWTRGTRNQATAVKAAEINTRAV